MKKNQPIALAVLVLGLAAAAHAAAVDEAETPTTDSGKAAASGPVMPGYVGPYQAPMPQWSIPQPPAPPAFTAAGSTETQNQAVAAQREALAKQYQQLEEQRTAMLEAQREAAEAAAKQFVPTDVSGFTSHAPWAHAPYPYVGSFPYAGALPMPFHPVGPVGYAGAPMFETHQQIFEQISEQAAAQQQHVIDTLQQAQERHMSAMTNPFPFRGPYLAY